MYAHDNLAAIHRVDCSECIDGCSPSFFQPDRCYKTVNARHFPVKAETPALFLTPTWREGPARAPPGAARTDATSPSYRRTVLRRRAISYTLGGPASRSGSSMMPPRRNRLGLPRRTPAIDALRVLLHRHLHASVMPSSVSMVSAYTAHAASRSLPSASPQYSKLRRPNSVTVGCRPNASRSCT